MIETVYALFGWMPTPLLVIVYGVFAVFLFWSILRIIQIVMDIIPFV